MLGSKCDTLLNLKSRLKSSHICDISVIKVGEWKNDPSACLANLKSKYELVIVRSSAQDEDSKLTSKAGYYKSILNISTSDASKLKDAINEVIESYAKSSPITDDDEVLVQPMLRDTVLSGVVFTQELNSGAPYYIINYDDESGDTDSITSGKEVNKTVVIHRSSIQAIKSIRIRKIIDSVIEIEEVVGSTALDIEFAETASGEIYIFQVRPMAVQANWNRGITLRVNEAIERIYQHLSLLNSNQSSQSIWGQMPDWNPAEIIGPTPRPLAMSLYKKLITQSTWRFAREKMGYQRVAGTPLMYSFFGQPYIDVKSSFASFMPEGLCRETSEKILGQYLSYLKEHPEFHDKIEFQIALSAHTTSFKRKATKVLGSLTTNELRSFEQALLEQTNQLVTGEISSLYEQYEQIKKLIDIQSSTGNSHPTLIHKINDGIERCIEFGTLPFSILARHAFIAKDFLDALVENGHINIETHESIVASVKTVTSDFLEDLKKLSEGSLDQKGFMKIYGHLRPGTYDILSKRYDQNKSLDFNKTFTAISHKPFLIDPDVSARVSKLLKDHGYRFDLATFISYAQSAIRGREYAKFIFTRTISDLLEDISNWGAQLGLSRDEISFLDIESVRNSLTDVWGHDLESFLRDLSEKNRDQFDVTKALMLPHLITDAEDIKVFPLLRSAPNFITTIHVYGPVAHLTGREEAKVDLDDQIVVIESADPGFDWIFSKKIKGLITKFGGANSHMAIRCAELNIPAAIGCGTQVFSKLVESDWADLNCSEKRITARNL